MIIQPSAPRTAHLQPNVYPVICIGLRDHLLTNPQYGDGNVVMVQLQTNIRDPETGEFVILERMCNKIWSPRSSLWACAEALGYPGKVSETFDSEKLIGLRCQAVVKDDIGSDGQVYSKVDTLIPLPSAPSSSVGAQPLMQRMGQAAGVPWDAPPPAQDNPLAQQLYERADQLAQESHAHEEREYPSLNILSQGGGIDWDVFWAECAKRGISRPTLCDRLMVYDQELEGQLRSMMPLAVIDLLKPWVRS